MFVILFDMLLNPSFKVNKSVANIEQQLEQQLAQVNLYARKDFKLLGIGSLLEKKFLMLNELETSLTLKSFSQNTFQSFECLFLIWYKRLPVI